MTGLAQFIEFDIFAATNINGLQLDGFDFDLKYPTEVFGENVVQNGLVEVTKGEILQAPIYNLQKLDLSENTFRIKTTSSISSSNEPYAMTTVKEKLVHVKLDISNFLGLTNTTGEDFQSEGSASFYCGLSSHPFDNININDIVKLKAPKSADAIGITYTFENLEIIDGGSQVKIDIYAASELPTSFAGGTVKFTFNDNALSLNSTSTGFGVLRGEIIQQTNIYTFEEFLSFQPNEISIQYESFNVQNLYLLDNTPKKFVSVILPIDNCEEQINLEFLELEMQNTSNHYTGVDPIPWENYDPVSADDTKTERICGCVSAPILDSFNPPAPIPAGVGESITLTGSNFGAYDASTCKVIFPNGDDGGSNFTDAVAEVGDIINWSDTEITVLVPSVTSGEAFEIPACSGRIKIENACGSDRTELDEVLHIPYSVFNRRKNILFPANRIGLGNISGEGIVFHYSEDVQNWMKSAIESALDEWCAVTEINFSISDEVVPITQASPTDNFNTITLESISNDSPAAMLIGNVYLKECINPTTGRIEPYMKGIDFKINPDVDDPQRLKNNMLHELGHAHMINHSKDLNADESNNYLMFYSQTFVDVATIKNNDGIGANEIFEASERILLGGIAQGGGACAEPIGKGICNTSSTYDLKVENQFQLVPNPTDGSFLVDFTNESINFYKWEIRTINGTLALQKEQASSNQITIDTNLPAGVYIFSLFTKTGVISKKFVAL